MLRASWIPNSSTVVSLCLSSFALTHVSFFLPLLQAKSGQEVVLQEQRTVFWWMGSLVLFCLYTLWSRHCHLWWLSVQVGQPVDRVGSTYNFNKQKNAYLTKKYFFSPDRNCYHRYHHIICVKMHVNRLNTLLTERDNALIN